MLSGVYFRKLYIANIADVNKINACFFLPSRAFFFQFHECRIMFNFFSPEKNCHETNERKIKTNKALWSVFNETVSHNWVISFEVISASLSTLHTQHTRIYTVTHMHKLF